MKNFKTKLGVVVGTAVIGMGVIALPAMANTSSNGSWFTRMHTLMNQTFTPAQQEQFMSSPAMQQLHDSSAMQQAMQDQNYGEMQSLMNSDQTLKKEIGAQNVGKMNQMMGQLQGNNQSGN
ncbi:Hypothetical protein DEACI_2249 [Acididesulfobacillus acetoxydans]|uniref:Uncharacterized protein n=1 Tax=Acididesulfobacillus acetoxydans TaxID=1561005 RepID=A0A8S0WG45_9FIRM|nr:hypothetical protein [Acididesulfobacillus acetoxydans]CAA7601582.1 Hypothetical protein DEACI_2249 [Acididesulfobacillus acetoxydans]CEJ07069.1 Hypothetical protein DEACI_1525 [Acididesulfobacillus acetoxydans]